MALEKRPGFDTGEALPTPVEITNNATPGATDAFGRHRVSSPLTIFDAKQIFGPESLYFDDQEVSGSGTSSTWDINRASSVIGVSNTTAGRRVRQTFQRWNYQPGKSQLILLTGAIGTQGTGITAGMGYYDDENGIFFRSTEGTLEMVIRSNVTGTPVDTAIPQSAWNEDKLDGIGTSAAVLDPSKVQIWWCDFEWLGVGIVRVGFVIDGIFHTCHIFKHANVIDSVYMSTPNLPVRYEIENDGTGAASTLEAICSQVSSEGGVSELGCLHYASTAGTHVDTNTADTLYAIIGVRLQTSAVGQQVNFLQASMISETNDDFEWILMFNPTVAGTFTYADKAFSTCQTAFGVTANTVTGGDQMMGGFAKSASSITTPLGNAIHLGAAIDGTRDEIVLCARPLSSNADIQASLTWREVS